MRARLLFAAAVLAQLVVLYVPRAPSTEQVPLVGPVVDKVVHLSVFALVAWAGRRAGVPVRPLVLVLLAHAVVSELLQHWVLPHRSGDPLDALADGAGVLVGLLLPVRRGRLVV